MELQFRSVFDEHPIKMTLPSNETFLELFTAINSYSQRLPVVTHNVALLLEKFTSLITRPIISVPDKTDKIEFDFFKTPEELGLNEQCEIILSCDMKAGAGVLPLNSLYLHNSELKKYLKDKHMGIQCAFLYTADDEVVSMFINDNL
jgi:hypothetical protein